MSTRLPASRAAVALAAIAFSACVPVRSAPAPAPIPTTRTEPELLGGALPPMEAVVEAPKRDILGTATYDLPVEGNSWVKAELDFLVGQRGSVLRSWLERGDFYEAYIKGVLREAGVPTDLYHLAMIESGFIPTARSRAGAVGLWQFMAPTARGYGLRMDSLVDERMDPVRSTRAAARHLRGLHRALGDWPLAAAAYNAGSGRISRGLKAFGVSSYWDLAQRGDLAEETKRYVPRLYAMTVVGRDRARFGFAPAASADRFAFDSIHVEYATPLEVLAEMGKVPAERLKRLNPHFIEGVVPAGGYWVWVPAGSSVAMQRAWLASVFRKEGTVEAIQEANGLDGTTIRPAQELRIPTPSAERADGVEKKVKEHVVEPGESVWSIARKYGSSVEAINQANRLGERPIQPGQKLTIPVG